MDNQLIRADRCGRHVHLCREDLTKLFPHRNYDHGLKIEGQYVIKEKIDVVGLDGRLIKDVTVILPDRDISYVELSKADVFFLGFGKHIKEMYIESEAEIAQFCPKITLQTKDGKAIAKACIQLPHVHVGNSYGVKYVELSINTPLVDLRLKKVRVKENPGTKGVILHIDNDLYNAITMGGYIPDIRCVELESPKVTCPIT